MGGRIGWEGRQRTRERRERENVQRRGSEKGMENGRVERGRRPVKEGGEARRGKNLEMQHGGRESVAIITKGRQLNANTPGRRRGRLVDLMPPRRPRVANRYDD